MKIKKLRFFSFLAVAGSNGHFHIAPLELVQAVSESTFDVLSCVLLSFARAGHVLRPQPSVLPSLHTRLMLRMGAERPFFTWLATHARAAGTCRAVQARDS